MICSFFLRDYAYYYDQNNISTSQLLDKNILLGGFMKNKIIIKPSSTVLLCDIIVFSVFLGCIVYIVMNTDYRTVIIIFIQIGIYLFASFNIRYTLEIYKEGCTI